MKKLFDKIFLERHLESHPRAQHILKKLQLQPILITKLEDVFQHQKPYPSKSQTLALIVAEKRGEMVKSAPPAYGKTSSQNEKHFYFIHAYNCIYACEYCYLQGYFNSPDIVLFINHESILSAVAEQISKTLADGDTPYFHSGEFSDSLALSDLSGEIESYFDFFKDHPKAILELRTKSAKITPLLKQQPLPNVITSFSLSPEAILKRFDHKTASLKARLTAIRTLIEHGFPVALHLDPILYTPTYQAAYQELAEAISALFHKNMNLLQHISLGTLRFSHPVWKEVTQNYPFSALFQAEWSATRGFDKKIRYPRPLRKWMLNSVRNILVGQGIAEEYIYESME